MTSISRKLTLDRPTTYQIRVPGYMDASRSDWMGGLDVVLESDNEGLPVTALTGRLDQAALHGLLRRLYALGLPLISVQRVD